jgi:hypothetical protein
MDCRAFRQSHVAFVDDTLPGVEQRAMSEHVRVCAQCAQLDARVRRSLMAARSLDSIVPSDGFSARLRTRLEAERQRAVVHTPLSRGPSFIAFTSIAASVVGIGVLAVQLQLEEEPREVPRLAGIVASVPAVPESLFASSSALAAAISTSAPVWSLAYVADQMPIRFATAQLAEEMRER